MRQQIKRSSGSIESGEGCFSSRTPLPCPRHLGKGPKFAARHGGGGRHGLVIAPPPAHPGESRDLGPPGGPLPHQTPACAAVSGPKRGAPSSGVSDQIARVEDKGSGRAAPMGRVKVLATTTGERRLYHGAGRSRGGVGVSIDVQVLIMRNRLRQPTSTEYLIDTGE